MELPEIMQDIPVPAFEVQTLVENSVKHGLSARRGGGCLNVAARRNGERVVIEVADTGVGIPALYGISGASNRSKNFYGIGLRYISVRLEILFGESDLLFI